MQANKQETKVPTSVPKAEVCDHLIEFMHGLPGIGKPQYWRESKPLR
jgi:hypothetical protein